MTLQRLTTWKRVEPVHVVMSYLDMTTYCGAIVNVDGSNKRFHWTALPERYPFIDIDGRHELCIECERKWKTCVGK